MLVTCPETAHLEEVTVDDSSVGLLVRACSRFSPPCTVDCERTCTARIDRRRRAALLADDPTGVYGEETLVAIRI